MRRYYVDYYDGVNYKLYYTDAYHPKTKRIKKSEYVCGITRKQAVSLCIKERARLGHLEKYDIHNYPAPYIHPAGVEFPDGVGSEPFRGIAVNEKENKIANRLYYIENNCYLIAPVNNEQ